MAMSLKPASLILARMAAVSPFFTASGLMMLKVRCDTNISWLRFECNSLAFWQLFQCKWERPFCSHEHALKSLEDSMSSATLHHATPILKVNDLAASIAYYIGP